MLPSHKNGCSTRIASAAEAELLAEANGTAAKSLDGRGCGLWPGRGRDNASRQSLESLWGRKSDEQCE